MSVCMCSKFSSVFFFDFFCFFPSDFPFILFDSLSLLLGSLVTFSRSLHSFQRPHSALNLIYITEFSYCRPFIPFGFAHFYSIYYFVTGIHTHTHTMPFVLLDVSRLQAHRNISSFILSDAHPIRNDIDVKAQNHSPFFWYNFFFFLSLTSMPYRSNLFNGNIDIPIEDEEEDIFFTEKYAK